MGARVSAAFGLGGLVDFGTHDDPVFRYRAVRLPHPSGRNRYWRVSGAAERVREVVAAHAPWAFQGGDR
jgi:hypothetical protein